MGGIRGGSASVGAGSITTTEILDATIANADVSNTAAIAVSKLAATTASRALVSDSNGFIAAATTTSTEIGYVNGVTSALQTQLNTKAVFPVFTSAVSGSPISVTSQSYGDALTLNVTTTRASEVVLIGFAGNASEDGASAHTLLMAYKLDAGSDVFITDLTMPTSFHGNYCFTIPITIASAAAHTIKLRVANLEASKTSTIPVTATFWSLQF